MSQEKNSILKDDFYSMIQMQRVKVDDEYKLLLQNPNNYGCKTILYCSDEFC